MASTRFILDLLSKWPDEWQNNSTETKASSETDVIWKVPENQTLFHIRSKWEVKLVGETNQKPVPK